LRAACIGFAQDIGTDTEFGEETLKSIYESSLVLLYRLLFILYAESRGFLSLSQMSYFTNYSLDKLKHDIRDAFLHRHEYSNSRFLLYRRLQELFSIIDVGDASLSIPAYNGGLFSSTTHPFLEEQKVPDKQMAEAIFLLSCIEESPTSEPTFVDFRNFSERHLGDIYEGLLEYHLQQAESDLAVVRRDNREVYAAIDENSSLPIAIRKGEVYLVAGMNEKRGSGSYYTADYIVNEIVENCVDPICEQQSKKTDELAKQDGIAVSELIDEFLDIHIADFAMGSGHFLTAVARRIAEHIVTHPAIDISDVEGVENDFLYFLRMVIDRCIYGIDINPLAVELAKLSLWLLTLSRDKPLSFLDSHLVAGNSIVGIRPDYLSVHPGRFSLTSEVDHSSLIEGYFTGRLAEIIEIQKRIADIPDLTTENIKEKERLYGEFIDLTKRYRQVCSLWVSYFFGNQYSEDDLMSFFNVFDADEDTWNEVTEDEKFQEAQRLAEGKSYFSWELEFPEVFYRSEESGFDAIVGNPPWGISHVEESDFLSRNYLLAVRQYDSWDIFFELGLNKTRNGGYLGLVVPDSLKQPEHRETLKYLFKDRVMEVVHIGEGSFERVFRSAYSFVVNKDTPEEDHVVRTLYISANDRDLLELNQTTISRIFENRGTDIRQELFKHDDGVRLLIGLKEIDLEIINQMESDYIDWDAYFTDSRGVELGKRGLVIRCRECGKWQPAPDNFPRRPVQQIRCHSCDEVFTSSDDLSKTIVGDTRVNRNYKKILFGEDVNWS